MRCTREKVLIYVTVTATGLLATACGSPVTTDQKVDFQTDRASYAVGDTAWLTVTNRGPESIFPREVTSCFLEAERKVEDGWEFFSEPGTISCKAIDWLEPDEETRRRIVITADDFEPGSEYRFKTLYQGGPHSVVEIFSNPFLVER